MVKDELDIEKEMLFYVYESNKLGRRLKKSSHVCRELSGFHLAAFPYEIDKETNSAGYYIMDTYMKRQIKRAFFFNGEESVCLPFALVINGKASCRDVHIKVFTYLYPILTIPANIKAKLLDLEDENEKFEKAYELIFEKSNHGDEYMYELSLVNSRESHEG